MSPDQVSPAEVQTDEMRFAFGKNWHHFLAHVDEDRIQRAEISIGRSFQTEVFAGKRFLDIGSGSGLFSLAANRRGANLSAFDFDADSVACTRSLLQRFGTAGSDWVVGQGSILDRAYLDKLGTFDYVYSWGVLHHTGNMWAAVENAQSAVKPGGRLCIALYNDQGWISRYWLGVKKVYNKSTIGRSVVTLAHIPYPLGARMAWRFVTGRMNLERGMSFWNDYLDWLGGYPFEVAKPEDVVVALRTCGFALMKMKTCGGRAGCNEFLFCRGPA